MRSSSGWTGGASWIFAIGEAEETGVRHSQGPGHELSRKRSGFGPAALPDQRPLSKCFSVLGGGNYSLNYSFSKCFLVHCAGQLLIIVSRRTTVLIAASGQGH